MGFFFRKNKVSCIIFINCVLLSFFSSCTQEKGKKQVELYQTQCASCHLAPNIKDLTKEIWATKILPDMAARMGIKEGSYNPMEGLSFSEMEIINKSGIYPLRPTLSPENWKLLKEYIIAQAPDSLIQDIKISRANELTQFEASPVSLDSLEGTFITFLNYDAKEKKLFNGDLSGNLFAYDFGSATNQLSGSFGTAITAHTQNNKGYHYTTGVGNLNPSEFSSGRIFLSNNGETKNIPTIFHRPVHTLIHDFNKDGVDELVVSEFGNLTGQLSLLVEKEENQFEKTVLLNQPGTIKVISKDMNADGKDDLIALTSQGDETISILYQQDDLKFLREKVIQFSPVYGISWFELIDYDNDGDDDIITVNGDNADKSYIQKPYHGLRIHINDGNNNFKEEYFYPLNGATRLVANDFDKDSDIDFAVISTFPDYVNHPSFSFVYLENKNSKAYEFAPFTFSDSKVGRWFLMDSGDIDNDGDTDIILSSFTYVFTPVPKELSQLWKAQKVDLMVLKNKLVETK